MKLTLFDEADVTKNKANRAAKDVEADENNQAIETDEAEANKAEEANDASVVDKAEAKEAIVAADADVANKAIEADKAIETNLADLADEAIVVDKAEAKEAIVAADANVANKAIEADEAIETNLADFANEAIVANEANKILAADMASVIDKAVETNNADKADKENELDELVEANKSNAANAIKKAKTNEVIKAVELPLNSNEANAIVAKKVDASVANEAKAVDETKAANVTNRVDNAVEAAKVDPSIVAIKANQINEIVAAGDFIVIKEVVLGLLTMFLPFSLTKYTAIFMEVKGCFGIFNNQLGGLNCWIILNKKQQENLCVQRCHNCWIVMDIKQQETWCLNSCSCNS